MTVAQLAEPIVRQTHVSDRSGAVDLIEVEVGLSLEWGVEEGVHKDMGLAHMVSVDVHIQEVQCSMQCGQAVLQVASVPDSEASVDEDSGALVLLGILVVGMDMQ